MRYTSARRRQGTGGRKYRGPARLAKPESSTDVTEAGAGTVVCASCGARVRMLATGNPRAHAPGGLSTNTRLGRFKCPGSGNDGTKTPR